MTIEEFIAQRKIQNKRETVIGWLKKGYVPGAYQKDNGEWFIPERAWPPYTEARAKNQIALYRSILIAIKNFKYPLASCYSIPEADFNDSIEILVKLGFIAVNVENGISYYKILPEGDHFISEHSTIGKFRRAIEPLLKPLVAVAEIVGAAAMKHG